jgi:hypothetical protein
MITPTLSEVRFFFDKRAIMTPAEKFQHNLLSKFGATVRKVQRNSLKRGRPGQKSMPGKPPLRHSGRPDIKDTVFFFVDRAEKNVVIGMVLLDGKPQGDRAMPGVLEHGGITLLRHGQRQASKQATVMPRPSATPAFDKVIKTQLPSLIEGGIMREV